MSEADAPAAEPATEATAAEVESDAAAPEAVAEAAPAAAEAAPAAEGDAAAPAEAAADCDAPADGEAPTEGAEGDAVLAAPEEVEMQPVEDPGPPPDVTAIFISGPTQEIFNCVPDDPKSGVTEDNPKKMLQMQEILDDLNTRRAVSDFAPFKDKIKKMKCEQFLIVYDAAFVHGENFYAFFTVAEMEQYIKHQEYLAWVAWEKRPKKKKKAAAGSADDLMGLDDEEEDSEDDEELPPPKERPLEWVSLGSEPEVLAGQCNPTRPPIKLLISRRRRYFGTPIRLADRVNDAVNEDGDNVCFGEWKAKEVDEEDPPPLHRKQLDNAAQAVIVTSASSAQTNWPRPRNVAISCQISTRGTEAEAGPAVPAGQPAAAGKPSRPPSAAGSKPSSAKKGSRPTTSASTGTGPDPAAVSPEEAAAAKLNSFLSTVMPTVRDALVENELLRLFDDDFVELAKHNGGSNVLVGKTESNLKEYQSYKYSGADFEQTIPCAAWHPEMGDVIAVSCARRLDYDGRTHMSMCAVKSLVTIWNLKNPIEPQVVLEAPDDIVSLAFNPTETMLLCGGCVNGQVIIWDLSAHESVLERSNVAKGGNNSGREIPRVTPVAASSIEHSHRASISDVTWLPPTTELTRSGAIVEADEGTQTACYQLLSVASDTASLVWDMRFGLEKGARYTRAGVKALDLVWKPLLKIFVGSEPGLDNGGRKIAVRVPSSLSQEETTEEHRTKMYVGTERGNMVYMDWRAPESDTGKIGVQKHEYAVNAHAGPVISLRRSPFIPSLLLSVGGQSVCVFHEGTKIGPLLQSSVSGVRATSGEWSCQRPGVFFVGKSDGTVDVWDLMDTSYAPVVCAAVCSPVSVNFLKTKEDGNDTYNFMAAGDDEGALHIIELPLGLTVPVQNEQQRLQTFIEEEFKRLEYVKGRMDARGEQAGKKGDDFDDEQVDDESAAEALLTAKYTEYLRQEKEFLVEMGLLDADEEGGDD